MSKQDVLRQRIAEAKRIMDEKRTWVSAIEEARKLINENKTTATLYEIQEIAQRLVG